MLKPVDIEASFDVVWPQDPAINTKASNLDAYREMLAKNPTQASQHLAFKDGAKPTTFSVGLIPPHLLTRFEDLCGVPSKQLWWVSFLNSVRAIDNPGPLAMERKDERGKTVVDVPTIDVNGIKYCDPEYLAKVFTGPLRQAALFIGAASYTC